MACITLRLKLVGLLGSFFLKKYIFKDIKMRLMQIYASAAVLFCFGRKILTLLKIKPAMIKNVFDPAVVTELTNRINKLTQATQPQWGKMSAAQMLAHTNVSYEFVYTDKHPKPNGFMKFILKLLVKGNVVGPKPYKKNSATAPAFLIKDERDFESERKRLIDHLNQTQQLGEAHFDGKESHSFGKLTLGEWNTMFYKHIDHHLSQFGV
jgi:hypothetical protein